MESKMIGKTLRKLRKSAGMSQVGFAEKVGLQQSMISQIERGERPLPQQRAKKFAEILGVTVEDLLAESADNAAKEPTLIKQTVKTSAQVNRWRDAIGMAKMDPYLRLVLSVLPAFQDESGLVVVTKDQLVDEANLSAELVDEHWEAVLESGWVERVGKVEWVLRLVFLEE